MVSEEVDEVPLDSVGVVSWESHPLWGVAGELRRDLPLASLELLEISDTSVSASYPALWYSITSTVETQAVTLL